MARLRDLSSLVGEGEAGRNTQEWRGALRAAAGNSRRPEI
jgi:hypothetical protein